MTDAGIDEPDIADFEDTTCHVCSLDDNAHQLLLCDGAGCDRGYHSYCLRPPLADIPLEVRMLISMSQLQVSPKIVFLIFSLQIYTQDEQWFCPKCIKAPSKRIDDHTLLVDRDHEEKTRPMCTTSHHRCRFAQFVVGKRMPRCLFFQENHKTCISCQRRFRKIQRDGKPVNARISYEISDLTEHVLLHEEHLPASQVQEIMALFRPARGLSESSGM